MHTKRGMEKMLAYRETSCLVCFRAARPFLLKAIQERKGVRARVYQQERVTNLLFYAHKNRGGCVRFAGDLSRANSSAP